MKLQAYQADLHKDLDQGEDLSTEAVGKLSIASLPLNSPMDDPCGQWKHLLLNLSGIKDSEKTILLDASVSQFGLFGTVVETVVKKFSEA